MQFVKIRDAAVDDAEAIQSIFAYHVQHGTATFETVPPSCLEWESKIKWSKRNLYTFLVACDVNSVLGYAYISKFRDRPAYNFTCEDSVYVNHEALGRGIGTSLLTELIKRASNSGFRQMIAMIGDDWTPSRKLHERMGFQVRGQLPRVGWKFEKWRSLLVMQKELLS